MALRRTMADEEQTDETLKDQTASDAAEQTEDETVDKAEEETTDKTETTEAADQASEAEETEESDETGEAAEADDEDKADTKEAEEAEDKDETAGKDSRKNSGKPSLLGRSNKKKYEFKPENPEAVEEAVKRLQEGISDENMTPQMEKIMRRQEDQTKRVEKAIGETHANPRWFVPAFSFLLILGLLWVVVYYITGLYPIPAVGAWNLAIGAGISFIGFIMLMWWH